MDDQTAGLDLAADPPASQVAGSDAQSNVSGECQSVAEAADQPDDKVEEAGEQDGDSAAPKSQNDGVALGLNGKPKEQRMRDQGMEEC